MDKKIHPSKKYINRLFEKHFIPAVPKLADDIEVEEVQDYSHETVDHFILERNKYSDF